MNTSTTLLPHHRLTRFVIPGGVRVYKVALEFLRAVRSAKITDRDSRDQALRSAKSACRNIAEAAGRVSRADKARVFGIARGEAVEAIATTEIAVEAGEGAAEALPLVLDRGNALYAMLSGLVRARYGVVRPCCGGPRCAALAQAAPGVASSRRVCGEGLG